MSDAPAMDPPLLDFDGARIALRDGGVTSALNLSAPGPRVALVGAFRELFALLSGEGSLATGRGLVYGEDARHATQRGVVGLALLDPVLPKAWTPERYLVESGLLAGFRARQARSQAIDLLQRFELVGRARHQLGDLLLSERRALVLAGAVIGNPPVLVAEAPLARLDAASQLYLQGALARAVEGRRAIVSVPELAAAGAERSLVEAADQVLWERPNLAAALGAEGAARRVTLAVLASGDAFCALLDQQGIRYEALPIDPVLLGLVPQPDAGVRRLLIELPAGLESEALFAAALTAGAPIAELVRHV